MDEGKDGLDATVPAVSTGPRSESDDAGAPGPHGDSLPPAPAVTELDDEIRARRQRAYSQMDESNRLGFYATEAENLWRRHTPDGPLPKHIRDEHDAARNAGFRAVSDLWISKDDAERRDRDQS